MNCCEIKFIAHMNSNFQPPTHDIETREIYSKGNLQVKSIEKLFIFRDTREIHLLNGYYFQDKFVRMSVLLDLRISKKCLIQESNVHAVEQADNNLYIYTVEGYFLKRTNFTEEIRNEIIQDINNEQNYNDNEDEDEEIVLTKVLHGTIQILDNFNNE